ncbi:hypothetical protein EIP86_004798 [Pleurotus ostreatoroseus]|nr:hypothetical protein EIP86_004798 [Pleurotus ostreatoroseus]
MDGVGNLAGWRWIFILEGIATVLIAFFSWIFMPADLLSAKFFTEEERAFAVYRFHEAQSVISGAPLSEPAQKIIAEDERIQDLEKESETRIETRPVQGAIVHEEDERFEWREVIRVWLTAIAYMGIIVPLYSFSLFLPTIVSGLGFTGESAQLHTVPPYVPAAVLTVVVAILSDKLKWRGPFMLIFLPIAAIGYIIAVTAENNVQRYIAVHLIATGLYPCGPCILSILPNNCAGHYKKATAVALQLAISNCGTGHSIALAFVLMAWVFVALNVIYCIWENKARANGRRDNNIEKYQELWDTGKTRAPIGDRSPAFRFTL